MENFYRAESPQQPLNFKSTINCVQEPQAARAAQKLKLVSKTTSKRIDSCLRRRKKERLAAKERGEHWEPGFMDNPFLFTVKQGILAFGEKSDADEYSNMFTSASLRVEYKSDDWEYAGQESSFGRDQYLLRTYKRTKVWKIG